MWYTKRAEMERLRFGMSASKLTAYERITLAKAIEEIVNLN